MKWLFLIEKILHFQIVLKNFLYGQKIILPQVLKVPVISIGNVSFGGTGKTPFVVFIAKELATQNRICVVAKSYKAKLKSPARIDLSIDNAAAFFGDEATLVKFLVPEVSVWSGPNKLQTARQSLQDKPQLILVDDGFTHRQLHRNLDIVLIDAVLGFKSYLREPKSAIRRADLVVITKCNLVSSEVLLDLKSQIIDIASNLRENIFEANYFMTIPVQDSNVMLVCTVARPQIVVDEILKFNNSIVAKHLFADHHALSDELQLELLTEYTELKGKYRKLEMVCTEKDAIKITNTQLKQHLKIVGYDVQMVPSEKERILEKIRKSL